MTNDAITIVTRGIRCDNTTCDYADMEAEFDPDKYLNMPCPKCGDNLFTEADYRLMQIMSKVADTTNDAFKDIDLSGYDTLGVMLDMDGSGNLKLGAITGRSSGEKV